MIIYLAGAETWWERFRAAGIRNQLFSYFYLRKQKSAAKTIAARKRSHHVSAPAR
jgi:hypothetical protein